MLDKITEINEKITLYADGLNKAEIKKVREESEINSNKNRLWEEYELVFSADIDGVIVAGNLMKAVAEIIWIQTHEGCCFLQ